jgi:hypothetical protein
MRWRAGSSRSGCSVRILWAAGRIHVGDDQAAVFNPHIPFLAGSTVARRCGAFYTRQRPALLTIPVASFVV